MTINIEGFKDVSDGTRSTFKFDDAYLYVKPNPNSGYNVKVLLSPKITCKVRQQIGDSVRVRYSTNTGIIVLTAGTYESSRVVSSPGRKGGSSSISCTAVLPTIERLHGKHRYYGLNWRFDNIDGERGRALVLEPNGRWKD